ncbi:hypothetical protein ATY77_26020 [Rhizobium sp. R634]|nr:hypothetical protein ATY77_26020 [Rhizobium sp. R634]
MPFPVRRIRYRVVLCATLLIAASILEGCQQMSADIEQRKLDDKAQKELWDQALVFGRSESNGSSMNTPTPTSTSKPAPAPAPTPQLDPNGLPL